MARIRVLLPAPLGPMRPYRLPRLMLRRVEFSRIFPPYASEKSQSHRSSPGSVSFSVSSFASGLNFSNSW
ncbi:hypothetical protein MT325_m745L [Paramecium bursaria chlorella virus MT325]|uniref:Uncharacterized protein m745L n=1 Tax=Paramecium bursaria Chlorella virus MT325 TaxID=346932 RepID=A7IVC5_PBCVM|nr:hypothetical protein MT325_m745L [Paramecium bursaria chlorella virus MT325]